MRQQLLEFYYSEPRVLPYKKKRTERLLRELANANIYKKYKKVNYNFIMIMTITYIKL